MSADCGAELCRNWTGQGCICEVMDLEPDLVDECAEHGRCEDCGNCLRCGNCVCEMDFDDPDDDEWQPDRGECDNCGMAPGEVNTSGPFALTCACGIGQGAPPELCRCGPRDTNPTAEGGRT
ncbi:hypothetical protein [Nocardia wallacei]|uniref:hypothetical protein n=1 Tax=Nocardia wallacei TaxID=480035 RepID=UPI002454108B|nr:hypothetical protein [Nocardia wallacei]